MSTLFAAVMAAITLLFGLITAIGQIIISLVGLILGICQVIGESLGGKKANMSVGFLNTLGPYDKGTDRSGWQQGRKYMGWVNGQSRYGEPK